MKSFACKDAGVQCDWTVQGENEEEILRQAEQHARDQHGFKEFPDSLKKEVRDKIREVKAA